MLGIMSILHRERVGPRTRLGSLASNQDLHSPLSYVATLNLHASTSERGRTPHPLLRNEPRLEAYGCNRVPNTVERSRSEVVQQVGKDDKNGRKGMRPAFPV